MLNISKKYNIKTSVFWWNLGLKSIFLIILGYFIYKQVFLNNDLSKSWEVFRENLEKGNSLYLFICIALMPINWIIESIKWRILVQPFEKISSLTSFKAVLSGISVALLTPNRIGEYGGRMVMVEAQNNWKAVISTLISSYSQNIWNIGIGLLAAILFLQYTGKMESYLFAAGIIVSVLFLALILLFYFNIKIVSRILLKWEKNKYVKKALVHLQVLEKYETILLFKVLVWALIRYGIYFIQYYFILKFFGLDIDLLYGFVGIGTIFLVQTSLPLPPIIGFVARGEIALLVWSSTNFQDLSILGASYTLWFLNLIIPSIIGSIIILSSNLWRTLGLASWIIRRK